MIEGTVSKLDRKDLLFTMLFPSIIGKMALVYCGLMYSAYPGEGWGYALSGFICFTVLMVARFLWKYRHWDDSAR